MQFDKIALGRQAKELGFVRDTFEKVCRLAAVLRFFEQDAQLSTSLALKGGTAINLTIFNLPRLSVDIDLDFSENVPRGEMLDKRERMTTLIGKYMQADGYALSLKSKKYHALDSFVYEYQNAAGMKDNLKIEINYMLRCHVLQPSRRTVNLPWLDSELSVLSVAPIEIYASKIVALLNRAAPRDLYDVDHMLQFGLFDASEQALLRKCIMLYSAIGSDTVPDRFSYDEISKMPQYKIKTDLLPVLRNSAYFDVKAAQSRVTDYLTGLLQPTKSELEFWEAFRAKEYRPELLFEDPDILARICQHPMAVWKCSDRTKLSLREQLRGNPQQNSQVHRPRKESHDDFER